MTAPDRGAVTPKSPCIEGAVHTWNAELLGWHVAKSGTRFEAIQALGMAVHRRFGHLSAGAARGLALRHDHGSNFMARSSRSRCGSGAWRRATPSSASPRRTVS